VCGRYSLASTSEELIEVFDVPSLDFDLVPRWNIAPGQECPVLAEDRRGRRIGLLLWGFVPSTAELAGRPFVNARAETIAEVPAFRDAFASRRCLVPADGFYEWRKDPGGKTPFWLHPSAGGLVTFAGIWERWGPPGHEPRRAFAILTVDANDDVRHIHDRMPAVVAPSDRDSWLDRSAPTESARALLRPAPTGTFAARRVSRRVNSVLNDGPELLEPVDD
jgi:putative SOS response-associated peptidase YedK